MIVVGLSKQQAVDIDPKAIQQINSTANLDRAGNTKFYFILREAKEPVFEFSQGTAKVLWMHLNVSSFIFISIKWHNTIV